MSCAAFPFVPRAYIEGKIHAMAPEAKAMLATIQEQVGAPILAPYNVDGWPNYVTTAIVSTPLKWDGRFTLTKFLLGNGVSPLLMAEYYLRRGMLSDASARENVANLIKQHQAGEWAAKGYTCWLMRATTTAPWPNGNHAWDGVGDPVRDKKRTIQTPSFANDDGNEWDAAVELLMPGKVKSVGDYLMSMGERTIPQWSTLLHGHRAGSPPPSSKPKYDMHDWEPPEGWKPQMPFA